jgi:hypothetical protein
MNPEIKPDVLQAIEELKAVYGAENVEVTPEPQGGAYVIVRDINLSEKYAPSRVWIGFLITFNYPLADVYPHYVNGNLKFVDGREFANPVTPLKWRELSAFQISRRSNSWNPAEDTAETKLAKIIQFLNSL